MASPSKSPRLRQDLGISQVDSSNYEITDSATGASLQIDSVGYLLAEQFESGEYSIDEVAKKLREQHGIELHAKQILDFLQKCDKLGLLETPLSELGLDHLEGNNPNTLQFSAKATLSEMEEIRRLEADAHRRFAFFHSIGRSTWITILSLIGVFLFPWKFRVGGPLVVEAYEKAVIRASTSGILEEIFVREGDHVTKNQSLIRLKGLKLEMERKRSEIAKVDAELKRLEVGPTKEEINQARKRVELARKIESQANENATRAKELNEKGLIPKQELQLAVSDHEVKLKALEQVEAELSFVEKGTRPETILAKKAELGGLQVDLKLLEELGERSLIRSPIDGVVATPDLPNMIGKQFNPGDVVMEITSPDHITLRAEVREGDISHVEIGKKFIFKVQAMPDMTFQSKVSRIAPVGELSSGVGDQKERIFRVYADSENPTHKLLLGMTGIGQIDAGWRTIGALFFRKTIVAFRVAFVI